jgi:tRNA G18 (ribose-2'-O)-methylase SpoU
MVSLYKKRVQHQWRYRKTSAGAVFNIPICKVEHIKDAIFLLQASGIKTIAATERQIPLSMISLNEPVAIIMGSEDRGVNPSVLKIVDEKLNFNVWKYWFLKCFSSLWCFFYMKH